MIVPHRILGTTGGEISAFGKLREKILLISRVFQNVPFPMFWVLAKYLSRCLLVIHSLVFRVLFFKTDSAYRLFEMSTYI